MFVFLLYYFSFLLKVFLTSTLILCLSFMANKCVHKWTLLLMMMMTMTTTTIGLTVEASFSKRSSLT